MVEIDNNSKRAALLPETFNVKIAISLIFSLFLFSSMLPAAYAASANKVHPLIYTTSNYTVGFATGNAVAGSVSSVSLTLPSGYTTYLWAGANRQGSGSVQADTSNWIKDTNATATGTGSRNVTSIGHNTLNIGNFITTATGAKNWTLVGAGANVIYSQAKFFHSNTATSNTLALTMNVPVGNSYAVLLFAIAGNQIKTVSNVPSACTQQQSVNGKSKTSSMVYICSGLAAGNYILHENAVIATGSHLSMDAGAYVFAPYKMALDDNPTVGSIFTNGTQQNNGNTITVIGSGMANAIIPSGASFSRWTSSNPSNIIIGSATSANTSVTVEGNGTLTAAYAWNVAFDDSPAAGNIVAGGLKEGNGNTLAVLNGNTLTINAVAPSGYTFNGWQVSNSVDLVVTSPTSANTMLTVDGPGTLTANYVPIAMLSITISPASNATADQGQYESFNGVINGVRPIPVINATNVASLTATVGSANEHSIALTVNGTQMYVTNEALGTVSIYNVPAYTLVTTVTVGSTPKGVTISPNGKEAWVGNSGGTTVSIINTSTYAVNSLNMGTGSNPREIMFSPNGATAYVIDGGTNYLAIVNVSTLAITKTIAVGSTPKEEIFMDNNATIWVTDNGAGNVDIISLASNSVTGSITVSASPHNLAVTPNGATVWVTDNLNSAISVINVSTQTVKHTLSPGGGTNGDLFTLDGSTAYILGSGSLSEILIANVATNTITSEISVSAGDGEDPVMNTAGTAIYMPTASGVAVLSANSQSSAYGVSLYVMNSLTKGVVYSTSAQFYGTTWSFNGIQTTAAWVANSPLVANVVMTANSFSANSAYTPTFSVNPALADGWSASNGTINTGATQTLTATTNGGTGTSPWTYDILVYNATGSLVYNSLSPYTSSTSNAVSFTQNSAWGTGTFTANLLITDHPTTPVTVKNSLAYTVKTVASSYNVVFNDNPATAEIVANGSTESNGNILSISNGNTINVNATAPAGSTGAIFSGWSVSNGNLAIQSTSAANTTLTVNGPGTLTSNFAWNVAFNDSPSTGNIVFGGSTESNGNVATVVNGNTVTINAIAPTGYAFNAWQVSNTANIIVANANSVSTQLTVDGPGTLTANYTIPAVPPTISLPDALVPNSIEVLAGYPSDNASVTATCTLGDTCQIWSVGGSGYLATGTGTATLAYNALPLGYTTLYANDTSAAKTSPTVTVRRINVAYAVTVTFTNQQSAAVLPNTPLMFAYNALSFTAWESNSLNNIAIAFSNGTVDYSWLEGPLSNERAAAYTFNTSGNVVFWVKSTPSNTFLGADTGTATTNTLIVAFGITSNNLLDGNFVGEAPQFSCANPASTSPCLAGNTVNGNYGQFDTGSKVFGFYDNFAGSTLSGLWTKPSGNDNIGVTVNNGLKVTGTSNPSYGGIVTAAKQASPQVFEGYQATYTSTGGNPGIAISESLTQTLATGNSAGFASGYTLKQFNVGTNAAHIDVVSSAGAYTDLTSLTPTNPSVASIAWTNTGSESANYQYGGSSSSATDTSISIGNYYFGITEGGTSYYASANYPWVRGRIIPPNGVMPAYSIQN